MWLPVPEFQSSRHLFFVARWLVVATRSLVLQRDSFVTLKPCDTHIYVEIYKVCHWSQKCSEFFVIIFRLLCRRRNRLSDKTGVTSTKLAELLGFGPFEACCLHPAWLNVIKLGGTDKHWTSKSLGTAVLEGKRIHTFAESIFAVVILNDSVPSEVEMLPLPLCRLAPAVPPSTNNSSSDTTLKSEVKV